MKKLKTLKMFAILIGIALATQSCLKDDLARIQDEEVIEEKETESLRIADEFSWKTTQGLELTITPNVSAILSIKSDDSKVYYKQFVIAGKVETLPITLPSYEQKLVIELSKQQKVIDLSLGEYTVVFN